MQLQTCPDLIPAALFSEDVFRKRLLQHGVTLLQTVRAREVGPIHIKGKVLQLSVFTCMLKRVTSLIIGAGLIKRSLTESAVQ